MRLLVANRGEIAIRVLRAATELNIPTVAIYSQDDSASAHIRRAAEAHGLRGNGAAAYLDIEQIVAVAKERGCDAIHPGYGFLSERADFAQRCAQERITFVGPSAEALAIFGDKVQARALAQRCGVPVLRGTTQAVSVAQAREFLTSLDGGAAVIKAVGGGGGRGMRVVHTLAELEEAYPRCQSEALAAFGNGELYIEQFMHHARHIEVQILADGHGGVSHLWERECSLQRRHQKLVEIAPCPALAPAVRERLLADAVTMARAVTYRNAGTFEFLVAGEQGKHTPSYAFIEANPRLQVEHTVTEEVLDVDVVKAQLKIAMGATLAELGLEQSAVPRPRGYAIQARINAETLAADGSLRPAFGTVSGFELPSGRGVRVDTAAHAGYKPNTSFDSLLAKVIGHSSSAQFADAVATTARALREFEIAGIETNIPLLLQLLQHPDFVAGRVYTGFIDAHIGTLAAAAAEASAAARSLTGQSAARVGAKVDAVDPLAVLDYGRGTEPSAPAGIAHLFGESEAGADDAAGERTVRAPMQATIVSIDVREGELIRKGQQLIVLNAMKMEHVIAAPAGGLVQRVFGAIGDTLPEGGPLFVIEAREVEGEGGQTGRTVDLDAIRSDLALVNRRRALTRDEARPQPVETHHKRGRRTAHENIADLCDEGSFLQYGSLTVAPSLQGTVDELLQYAPADGMVMGLGRINGEQFGPERSRCVVMSYDYTVLAGTQGQMNHRMIDRMFETAGKLRVPLVLFAEGGGGRAGGGSRSQTAEPNPGTPPPISGGGAMSINSWVHISRLSAQVPLVGIVSGRCFAGNAALLGCCDVIIATPEASIGMGGPAMIEGGGLGVYRPEEVGPLSVQVPNGVVDVVARDEAEAVRLAKQYLSYFQGRVEHRECADQRLLRGVIPENRLRVYDMRALIETLADSGSVLELRRGFGMSMITALARIDGRSVGIVANNPAYLSGAIDSPAADKAARFLKLCDAFDLPIIFLCDTPGIMVGPEAEKAGLVRHASRMFVVAASLSVPTFTVIVRKAYGLGAMTMGGGSHRQPVFIVSWPTGEFGGMGLEGQVKLGRRRELEAIKDPQERRERFDTHVSRLYERAKGINAAHVFEIDDVIDPADTRRWLAAGLDSAPQPGPRGDKKRPCIDPW